MWRAGERGLLDECGAGLQPPLSQNRVRVVVRRVPDTKYLSRLVKDGVETERVVLLDVPATLVALVEDESLVALRRLSSQRFVDKRRDFGPDHMPHLSHPSSKRPRVVGELGILLVAG
jgi:hypothetical protein